jgi:hypothetical protein
MFGSERRRRGISHHSTALELQFHEDMRPFLVDLREHFTQIPTNVFLRLRSGYAMKMYMQVRSRNPSDIRNKYPSWKMDIEQVRWFFRLSPDQYEEPKHIAAAVLKRSMRELNERADVTFRYDPIKQEEKSPDGFSERYRIPQLSHCQLALLRQSDARSTSRKSNLLRRREHPQRGTNGLRTGGGPRIGTIGTGGFLECRNCFDGWIQMRQELCF